MRSIEDIATTGAAWVTESELNWLCERASRVEKVLALHARGEAGCCIVCEDDGHVVRWPCSTVRILNGEEA